jgi:uncharacterized protein
MVDYFYGLDGNMHVEDRFSVGAPKDMVWRAIRDPAVVAPCVPGCDGVEVISPTLYKALVRLQIGPIKAQFNIDVEITSEIELEEIHSRSRGEEGGRASFVSAESVLKLIALSEDETEVFYSAEVSVVGRLGKFGLGMMKKKVEATGRDFAAAFKQRIERRKIGV